MVAREDIGREISGDFCVKPTLQPHELKIKALVQACSHINFATGQSKDPSVKAEMNLLYTYIADRIETIKKENGIKSFT
jgi:hypothetical protein